MQQFTAENFDDEVLDSDVPVLVDFWAEWCGPCKALGPTVEEIASEYEGKVKVGKFDVDKDRNIPARYGVMSIPALVIFQGGEEVGNRITGNVPKDRITKELDAVIA